MHVGCFTKPSERFSQKSNESLFCPFWQGEMRQFELVWLYSQSSCVEQRAHHAPTHPPFSTQICGTVRTSVFTPYEILFGTAALDDHLSIAAAFRSGCFLKHKPLVFITTVALSYTNCLLIQLQESSWTIQKWNAVTSKKSKTGCVVPCLTRRGS